MSAACPRCGAGSQEGRADCASCGVIFAKLRPREEDPPGVYQAFTPVASDVAADDDDDDEPLLARFSRRLVHVERTVNPVVFWGRVLLYALFFIWGLHFIRLPAESEEYAESFLHVINLVFHEAGHVILGVLGWDFLTSLGGSLSQIVFPLICAGALLVQNRDPFGASIGVWWAGQSLMELGPYIGDARRLEMMLLGGVTGAEVEGHDWEAILTYLGLLEWDTTLARLAHLVGSLMILGSLAWGGYILWQQRRRLEV